MNDLEEAFVLSLPLPDCTGASNLDSCRRVERLLSNAFQTLETLTAGYRRSEEKGCFSCDPGPELPPLASSLEALGRLLEEKGHLDWGPVFRGMEETIDLLERRRCCTAGVSSGTPNGGDREDDARSLLTVKCGPEFAENRRGLLQVVRAPGERQGCFQSRACRKMDSYQGVAMEAGFWTYDGEYWYIWAERRTPSGEWIACRP